MKSIELFVGAGGLGMAANRAGFEPVAVLDSNTQACGTILRNKERGLEPFAHWNVEECDIRKYRFLDVPGSIDLVTGGPPCQPFSLGGRHHAQRDERDMFPQAVRAVRELEPRAFVFENVKGLTRPRFKDYFEYIKLQLSHPEIVALNDEHWRIHCARLKKHKRSGSFKGLHYNIHTGVLNAADFGVPQCRERIFIVGFRSDLDVEWHFPNKTHSQDALLWSQWRTGEYWEVNQVAKSDRPDDENRKSKASRIDAKPLEEPWTTVREAISDFPDPMLEHEKASLYLHHEFVPGARIYPGHTGSCLDKPAKTLKAGANGVPGGENMLRQQDGTVRYFTVRECARIQCFPNEMEFYGSWTEVMRQLGNAVPCDLAHAVLQNVRGSLV